MSGQDTSSDSLHDLLRRPRAYLRRPLGSFVASRSNRQLLYYKLALFFALTVMAGLALVWQRAFISAHLAFYITHTLHLAFTYLIAIILVSQAFRRLCPGWSAYERRTVARQWCIWGLGFVAGYLLHRLVAVRLMGYYAPWLNDFLRLHPEAIPSPLEVFVFFATAWLLATFAVLQAVLRLQGKAASPEAEAAPAPAPAPAAPPAFLSVSHDGRRRRIPLERITHVTVEDHYCRIHFLDAQGPRNLFVCTTLKSLADQLPERDFAQIHRSHLVNLRRVTGLRKSGRQYYAEMPGDGIELPISRHRWPELQKQLSSDAQQG